MELVRLYADQEVIGKGYGWVLMEACLEEAHGAGYRTTWLGVWEGNDRAIGFYTKWGFLRVGSREFVLGATCRLTISCHGKINSDGRTTPNDALRE